MMARILIIGEYSGFAANLKAGLRKHGCEVTVFTSGDGFKKIGYDEGDISFRASDINVAGIRLRGTWRIRGFRNFLSTAKFKKLNRAALDLILILNPDFIFRPGIFRGYFTLDDCRRMLKGNGKVFLSACGVDIAYLRYGGLMRYWPFSGLDTESIKSLAGKLDAELFYSLIGKTDGVIPVMFDNAFVYRRLSNDVPVKITKTIPLPVDCSVIDSEPNIPGEKIVIFHGKSRDDFKGSDIIISALMNVKSRYPDSVELLLPGRLPFDEYLSLMRRSNIVVDQCRSYSYAMNALFAMAMGKVVLSGNEPECSAEFGRAVPVINILPEVKHIENEIEKLLTEPDLITSHGEKGRQFVEQLHDAGIVASGYLSLLTQR